MYSHVPISIQASPLPSYLYNYMQKGVLHNEYTLFLSLTNRAIAAGSTADPKYGIPDAVNFWRRVIENVALISKLTARIFQYDNSFIKTKWYIDKL